MVDHNKSDNIGRINKNLADIHFGPPSSDGGVKSKNLKNERLAPKHRGMPPSIKVFIFHVLLVCLCLNDVSGEDVINAGNDQLLSVRSIRNWFRIPEPSMIARVSKRGQTDSFFDMPDPKMVARVSKRGFFDENIDNLPKQMVARVSKKGLFLPDRSMVARVSKRGFFLPDKNMVARVSKRGFFLPDRSMVARVSKRGFFLPDRSMVARVSKKKFFVPDRSMVARVSKKSLSEYTKRSLSEEDIPSEDPYGDSPSVDDPTDEGEPPEFLTHNRKKRDATWLSFLRKRFNAPSRKSRFRRHWQYVLDRPSRCLSCRSWH